MSIQMTDHKMAPSERFMRLDEVMAKTGLRKNAIYDKQKAGTFPASVTLNGGKAGGGSNVAFVASEVERWMIDCVKARDYETNC